MKTLKHKVSYDKLFRSKYRAVANHNFKLSGETKFKENLNKIKDKDNNKLQFEK